jgi:HrpA-like RNA helicase
MSNNTNSANVNNRNSGANAITPQNNNNALSNKNTVIIGNNNRENLNNRNRYPYTRDIYVPREKLFEPIGILDPEGVSNNPLTNEPYQNLYYDSTKNFSKKNTTYQKLAERWSNYPMYSKREEAINLIYDNNVILVVSGTGSGKTVLTPKFALHCMNYQGRIAITNPKRVPTKENTLFSAMCMDVKVGSYIGMKYRDSEKGAYSTDCRLIYSTDGYILQLLQKDPLLTELDMVIIDEAHERNVNIDLLLLLLKQLVLKRPAFKLIIMSATINTQIFVDYFPTSQFKFVMLDAGQKPNYAIKSIYLNKPINKYDENGNIKDDNYFDVAVDKVVSLLKETDDGDILVFFPSKSDTTDGCSQLSMRLDRLNRELGKKIYCATLTSSTSKKSKDGEDEQEMIINSQKYKQNGRFSRKVVFATEVAESSITIDGLLYVIDTGLVNKMVYYSDKNMESLEKKFISKASHKQRRGRTGRTAPGTCFCLFTEEEYNKKFPEYTQSPIMNTDLSKYLMTFLANQNFISHIQFPIVYKGNKGNKSNKANKGNKLKLNDLKKPELVISKNSNKHKRLELRPKTVGGGEKNKKKRLIISPKVVPLEPSDIKPCEFVEYLHKLIEVPPIDIVKTTIQRLVDLKIVEMRDEKGYITDLGRACAVFDVIPEIGRMIISGYNYHCRDDIINLAGLFEASEYKMDDIFERFRPKTKDEQLKRKEKDEYERVKKRWVNSLGDHFSLLDIYNEFCNREYDEVDRKSGTIIRPKLGETKEWCKKNYLNYNKLRKVKETARQYQMAFGRVVRIFKEKHPDIKPRFLFTDKEPVLSENYAENILRAILDGFFVNMMRRFDNRKYVNCYPKSMTTAQLPQSSLYASTKTQTKYAVYGQLKSIFGNQSFSIVSKIPPAISDEYKNSEQGKCLENCWKTGNHKKDGEGDNEKRKNGQKRGDKRDRKDRRKSYGKFRH